MKISIKNSKIIVCTIIFITLLLGVFLFFKVKYSRPVLTIGVYTDSSWNVPNGDADCVTKLAIKKFKKKYPNIVIKTIHLSTRDLFDRLSQYYVDFILSEKIDNISEAISF